MKHGFIKVCAATVPVRVADVKFNTEQIIRAIKESSKQGSQLTVFPELCVCGYTCGDLFNQKVLLDAVDGAIAEILSATSGIKTLVFIGAPVICFGKLYNCAVAISDGKLLGAVPKSCLPNYGEFYEDRNFSPALKGLYQVKIGGQTADFGTNLIFKANNCDDFTVSAEICEDLWAPKSPAVEHTLAGANIIVNLSCSDELVAKAEYRRRLIKVQSAKLICAYIYSDAGDGESTTDMTFAGHNIICENGALLAETKLFENDLLYSEIDVQLIANERRRISAEYHEIPTDYKTILFETENSDGNLFRKFSKLPFVPKDSGLISNRAELTLTIQAKGLEKRLLHTGCKRVVIGVSGGLDSALALLVIHRAFKVLNYDTNNIIAVTMPGFGTTSRTKSNAVKLIEALGASCRTISIKASTLQHFKDIGHDVNNYDVTYENAQARMRTLVLMDLANQENGLVIGTGDMSELALGWATYNGDHISMYNVNCSIPKTLVRYLVKYEADRLAGECGKILDSILSTAISPELLPAKNGKIDQKTEDLVGPYILHDFFMYYALRWGFTPEKILYIAKITFDEFNGETIEKWLRVFYKRFFSQQFKRSCVPDGAKVGSVSLSPRGDWRMPSDAVSKIWLDNIK